MYKSNIEHLHVSNFTICLINIGVDIRNHETPIIKSFFFIMVDNNFVLILKKFLLWEYIANNSHSLKPFSLTKTGKDSLIYENSLCITYAHICYNQ